MIFSRIFLSFVLAAVSAALLASSFVMTFPFSAAAQGEDVFRGKSVRIINPGKPLNHSGLDYAPAIRPDGKTLYYVSNRAGSKQNASGGFSHDFWSIVKRDRLDTVFFEPANMDTIARAADNGLNTARNEGVPSISANGRAMFFTGCDRPDVLRRKKPVNGVKIEDDACDIYIVEQNENGEWGIPRNLGAAVNSESWDGHPSISPDGSRLYFASDRPGGLGDVDIWYSDYDANRNRWLPAKNAGNVINTPFRDWSPFIAANNRELFFASEAHQPNYGGTDFYVAVRDEKDRWSRPRNLGQPINTSANEAFICTPASRDVLYFASQRSDISGYQGNFDIFMAFVPQSSLSLAIPVSGSVMDGCAQAYTAATISLLNPVTKRVFRDTLNGVKRVRFETVLTDFDFGPLDNPVDTLNLVLTVQHALFGVQTQRLTIVRPKPNANGVYESMPEIAPVSVIFGERPRLESLLAKIDPKLLRPTTVGLLSSGFQGLAMEEIVSVSVNRILNYVFFDAGSAQIPERYKLLKTPKEAAAFSEERLRGETLDKYYHTLDIFGSRLRQFPKAAITIVGCNDQASPGEKKSGLSKARANAVFAYLRDIWGISPKRMKLTARDLPAVPSNRDDSLGLAENRRVEILSDDWDIVKPVVDRSPLISLTAPTVEFRVESPRSLESVPPPVIPPAQPKAVVINGKTVYQPAPPPPPPPQMKRTLTILRGDNVWKHFDNISSSATITWNWKNDDGELPSGNEPLRVVYSVRDKSGRECFSETATIPVRRIAASDKKRQNIADKSFERYNLIMFPFDKSDVGPMNSRILKEYVLPRLFASSDVMVVGHTDIIGSDEYNLRLSAARGAKAKDELASLAQNKYQSLDSKGVGEAEPLFPNSLPEGRFYNRTVQVIIETPLTEEALQNSEQSE
jgi:outer membrane protein OmpA-like peptidoglycan-associated protein